MPGLGCTLDRSPFRWNASVDPHQIELGRRALPALDVWMVSSELVSLRVPAGLSGDFDVVALADSDDLLPEDDELNNLSEAVRLSVSGP
jgi:hypothetical protein